MTGFEGFFFSVGVCGMVAQAPGWVGEVDFCVLEGFGWVGKAWERKMKLREWGGRSSGRCWTFQEVCGAFEAQAFEGSGACGCCVWGASFGCVSFGAV